MIGPSLTTSYYSASDVQTLADYVKFRLFATVIDPYLEVTMYDPLLLGFMGKVTTLQFIPAAIDYWGDQLISESTTGTNETVTRADPRPQLLELQKRLDAEVKAEWRSMSAEYTFRIWNSGGYTWYRRGIP